MTVIGHAGLFIRSGSTTILVDPWLSGSCYWRSWWHFPPSPEPEPEWLAPTYLYLTHHHFDHFHYPSLRRIDRSTRVLIPRFGVDVMPAELRRLGFSDVSEMRHGEVRELSAGLRVGSYQYGFDDSAFIVADGDAVVYDLNDCKVRAADLAGLRRRFGSPTLLLKSHSWAQAYPNCYSAEDPGDLTLLSKQDYVADFLESVRAARPRYAAPFASMVCFLHPETWARNGDVVTPVEVARAFAADPVQGTELLLAKPGDTWDSDRPFSADVGDYYTRRRQWLDKLRDAAAPGLERAAAAEAGRRLPYDTFAGYFGAFLRSLPPGTARVLRRPVVFRGYGPGDPYWVLDWRRRRVWRSAEAPSDRATLVEVPEGVLADAVANRIAHFVHISMRVAVDLRRGGVTTDFAFWTLLAMWELGYLPVHRLSLRRFVPVAWGRRGEIAGALRATIGRRGSMASRMTSRFMSSDEQQVTAPPR